MTGRAYGRPAESPHHAARNRAAGERRRAIANRCTGRKKSTAQNPLPHVYKDIGADLMGCKHCPVVRQLTDVEYRVKYGVNRPPPRPASGTDLSLGDLVRAVAGFLVMAVIVAGIGASIYYGHAYCVAHGTCGQ